jgi:hypothetical protein
LQPLYIHYKDTHISRPITIRDFLNNSEATKGA